MGLGQTVSSCIDYWHDASRPLQAVGLFAYVSGTGYNSEQIQGVWRLPESLRELDIVVPSSHRTRPFLERSWGARLWVCLSYRLVGLFLRLIARVHIVGTEHLPPPPGVVLVSNHVSLLDTLLIPYSVMATQGVQIVWAPAKGELFDLPIVGRVMNSWGAFPVHRGKGDLRAIRRMITHMRTGTLMLFPEGTRSRDGRLGEGNRMVGKMIYEARPAVIPVVVWGTDRIWPQGRYLPRLWTTIGVRYGRPLDLQRFYALPNTKATAEAIVGEVMRGIACLSESVGPLAVKVPSCQA